MDDLQVQKQPTITAQISVTSSYWQTDDIFLICEIDDSKTFYRTGKKMVQMLFVFICTSLIVVGKLALGRLSRFRI